MPGSWVAAVLSREVAAVLARSGWLVMLALLMGSGCGNRTDSGGTGSRLVGVSAVTADVGAVVALAAVPVPASALVVVVAPAVVIVLAPAAIPAGDVAATPVIS